MSHVVICPECITLVFHRDVVCADTDLYKHKFFTCLLAQVKKQCKLHYAHTADDVPQFSGLRCQPQHAGFGSWLGDGTREVSPLTRDICPWQSPCLSGAARGGRISPPRVVVFCSGAVEQDWLLGHVEMEIPRDLTKGKTMWLLSSCCATGPVLRSRWASGFREEMLSRSFWAGSGGVVPRTVPSDWREQLLRNTVMSD